VRLHAPRIQSTAQHKKCLVRCTPESIRVLAEPYGEFAMTGTPARARRWVEMSGNDAEQVISDIYSRGQQDRFHYSSLPVAAEESAASGAYIVGKSTRLIPSGATIMARPARESSAMSVSMASAQRSGGMSGIFASISLPCSPIASNGALISGVSMKAGQMQLTRTFMPTGGSPAKLRVKKTMPALVAE
jgi:hypothetical protein